jgi:fructose-1,6-bisphosphatase/inositol monophosphatase family enzyme
VTGYDRELRLAKQIAIEAGDIILRYSDGDQQIQQKPDGTAVTIADIAVNRLVIERIRRVFPRDNVVGEEERTALYGPGRRWLCDPIDGTLAYIWGVPTAMFSLALVVDGVPVVGVVYDPFLRRIYVGLAGQASTCNGTLLRVSDKVLEHGIVAVTSDIQRIVDGDPFVKSIIGANAYPAFFCGAAYKSCLVARGRFVGFVDYGVHAYDVAAVHLIVEGAGGKITGLDGHPLDYSRRFMGVIVSNGKVHTELVAHVARALHL